MKKLSLMILLLVVALASCKKTPEVNLKYVDVERDLITVGMTTATVQCDYQYIATLKKAYLYYGEGEDEADMNTAEMRVVQNTLYVDLAGLKENTTYSYYYEFHNGFNSMRTVAKTFKTEGSGATITLPTVITAEVTEITTNSAKGGGEVTNDGGAEVTERGICWSTNENPTLNDSHVATGTGTGAFIAMMNGLGANTTYHVRAYATNEVGTAYGLDREFVTLGGGGGSGVPEGAIDGLFSVSPTQKVYFSQGNLQYQASTNTWRFADNQWDYVGTQNPLNMNAGGTVSGSDNSFISSTYNGWIDLFGWGTSGWDNGNIYYQPWNSQYNTGPSGGYGPTDGENYNYDLTGYYSNADWGVFNAISNGGNMPDKWRTLTSSEWNYLFNTRSTASGIRFVKSQVNGVNGVILLPDNWNSSNFVLNNTNASNEFCSFEDNIITLTDWTNILEINGAIFLPAAGYRNQTHCTWVGDGGYYWSATFDNDDVSFTLSFIDNDQLPSAYEANLRLCGQSVRLIQDAIPSSPPTPVITTTLSNITTNSVTCNGEVTNDAGVIVTERGFCWSMHENPTITDNHVTSGSGIGSFSSRLGGLIAGTIYYVRAYATIRIYATNSDETIYSLNKEFTTLSSGGGGENGDAPNGAINGLFTINSDDNQVYFSRGNLQYLASTSTWRFAENQFDYVGAANSNISSSYDGWIDLFGWGTSGWNSGNTYYNPWDSYNVFSSDLYGPSGPYDLTGVYDNADWGVYNPISNGGNTIHQWRTLTLDEWNYVINTRSTASGIRFAMANVNNVNGLILLPDNWSSSVYNLNNMNNSQSTFNANTISASQWTTLENAGAVFLPAAGSRSGTLVSFVDESGTYWSVSCVNSGYAYEISFGDGSTLGDIKYCSRCLGNSVRLVQDANR